MDKSELIKMIRDYGDLAFRAGSHSSVPGDSGRICRRCTEKMDVQIELIKEEMEKIRK